MVEGAKHSVKSYGNTNALVRARELMAIGVTKVRKTGNSYLVISYYMFNI